MTDWLIELPDLRHGESGLASALEESPFERLYAAGMIHGKAMVVDDGFAHVGSPNYDVRSLLLNHENALFLYGKAEIAAVTAWVDELRAAATTEDFDRARRERWLLERVARLLAPEL